MSNQVYSNFSNKNIYDLLTLRGEYMLQLTNDIINIPNNTLLPLIITDPPIINNLPGIDYDISTGIFTFIAPGKYDISSNICWSNGVSGTSRYILINDSLKTESPFVNSATQGTAGFRPFTSLYYTFFVDNDDINNNRSFSIEYFHRNGSTTNILGITSSPLVSTNIQIFRYA